MEESRATTTSSNSTADEEPDQREEEEEEEEEGRPTTTVKVWVALAPGCASPSDGAVVYGNKSAGGQKFPVTKHCGRSSWRREGAAVEVPHPAVVRPVRVCPRPHAGFGEGLTTDMVLARYGAPVRVEVPHAAATSDRKGGLICRQGAGGRLWVYASRQPQWLMVVDEHDQQLVHCRRDGVTGAPQVCVRPDLLERPGVDLPLSDAAYLGAVLQAHAPALVLRACDDGAAPLLAACAQEYVTACAQAEAAHKARFRGSGKRATEGHPPVEAASKRPRRRAPVQVAGGVLAAVPPPPPKLVKRGLDGADRGAPDAMDACLWLFWLSRLEAVGGLTRGCCAAALACLTSAAERALCARAAGEPYWVPDFGLFAPDGRVAGAATAFAYLSALHLRGGAGAAGPAVAPSPAPWVGACSPAAAADVTKVTADGKVLGAPTSQEVTLWLHWLGRLEGGGAGVAASLLALVPARDRVVCERVASNATWVIGFALYSRPGELANAARCWKYLSTPPK